MRSLPPRIDLTQEAHTAIRNAILHGDLPPGARLAQEAIAEQLGVSRQPVIRALGLLRHEGLVVERGRRGLVVASFEPARVRDLYQVRGALDGLAARLAAQRVDADACDALEPLLARGEHALISGGWSVLIAADVAFHCKTYDLSGNPEIGLAAETLWPRFRRAISAVGRLRGQDARMRSQTWRAHREIVAAICRSGLDHAERPAQLHC
jgi:DNA-binding GntR family transcriptional regulator